MVNGAVPEKPVNSAGPQTMRSLSEYLMQSQLIGDIEQTDLHDCKNCGRKFNPDSLAKHEPVCQRVFSQQRKVFNSKKQRIPQLYELNGKRMIANRKRSSSAKPRRKPAKEGTTPIAVSNKRRNSSALRQSLGRTTNDLAERIPKEALY